ncbi:MAG: twin-arginine translocation signal domain-containing protein [Bacteroidota bacterium]
MTSRRDFIKKAAAAGILSSLSGSLLAQPNFSSFQNQSSDHELIKAILLHLSYNMWEDYIPGKYKDPNYDCETCQEAREWAHGYRPALTFDDDTWNDLLKYMSQAGMNMVLIDVGDGIKYESHPEIAVRNALSTSRLRKELEKMRNLGLEPIPKLNFGAGHDIWLGKYSRMVSTDTYYGVCKDLIAEITDLFDKPRFFHLGMDEETAQHQRRLKHAVIRQENLWWGDFYFLIGEVEKNNVRPWIWSDYMWHHSELFFRKMPKSVLQSNWYYGTGFGSDPHEYVKYYEKLDKQGFDQIPTGSNHSNSDNMGMTVAYCKKIIDPGRLFGFMTAPWRPTLAPCFERNKQAVDQLATAVKSL